MKILFRTLAVAVCCLAAMYSCSNAEIEDKGKADADGRIELSVKGVLGEYEAEETRSSLVNNIRVGWEKDGKKKDTVLVFHKEAQKYLGYLVATVQNEDDRYATLGGTITAPTGEAKTLVFVHGTGLNPFSFTEGDAYESVTLDLSSQGEKTPFMVYGTAQYRAAEINGIIVDFSFATSVVSTFATGLPASTEVTQATLSSINTKCVLAIPTSGDLTVSGDTPDTITKSAGIESTNAQGQVLFEIAVPESEAASSARVIEFTINSKSYTAGFSSAAIASGKAYSAMAENNSVEGVVLNKTSTTISPGISDTLTATIAPSGAPNTSVTWASSNSSVVIVDENGIITGVALGTATITAASQDALSIIATCTVTVDNHGYVEIGGLKWATCNIGAANPTDGGWCFSWGNTDGYIHRDGSGWVKVSDGTPLGSNSFNETIYKSTPGYSVTTDIDPTSVNDAARINWGGNWRMPTKDEFQDLYEACIDGSYNTSTNPDGAGASVKKGIYWCENYDGVQGCLFVDEEGHKLFFRCNGGEPYWSSSWFDSEYAYSLFCSGYGVIPQYHEYYPRSRGHYIRPVSD